jgi:hypothetical protein
MYEFGGTGQPASIVRDFEPAEHAVVGQRRRITPAKASTMVE